MPEAIKVIGKLADVMKTQLDTCLKAALEIS
jgi:hypothetical protein